jgi:hypothetical protein
VLIGHHIVFVLWVQRLVLGRDEDLLEGEAQGRRWLVLLSVGLGGGLGGRLVVVGVGVREVREGLEEGGVVRGGEVEGCEG